MSDRSITSLIEKLEGAEVGSRELDAHVWASINGYELFEHDGAGWRYRMHPDDIMRHERTSYISPVTTSLDASLALAERVLPSETFWTVSHHAIIEGGKLFHAEVFPRVDTVEQPDFYGHAATPALALCASILRAQSEARV